MVVAFLVCWDAYEGYAEGKNDKNLQRRKEKKE
jgi:hypothetical protein